MLPTIHIVVPASNSCALTVAVQAAIDDQAWRALKIGCRPTVARAIPRSCAALMRDTLGRGATLVRPRFVVVIRLA